MAELGLILFVVGLLAVGVTIGVGAERSRRRALRAWAQEHHGTFEPGSLGAGVPVPEGSAFDGPFLVTAGGYVAGEREPEDTITHRNVVRIRVDEASYVVARSSRSKDAGDSSSIVCFVSLARAELPEIDVLGGLRSPGERDELARRTGREPLAIPDPAPGFAEEFTALPAPGAGTPEPRALARVLDRTVQAELLAGSSVLSGFQVRGKVVRIQARRGRHSQREVFEIARRLAAAWAARW